MKFSYYGSFNGPSFGYPRSAFKVSPETDDLDQLDPQYLYSEFRLDYFLTKNLLIGPIATYVLFSGITNSFESDFYYYGLRIGHQAIIETETTWLGADIRILYPSAELLKDLEIQRRYESRISFEQVITKHLWTAFNNNLVYTQFDIDIDHPRLFEFNNELSLLYSVSEKVNPGVGIESFLGQEVGESRFGSLSDYSLFFSTWILFSKDFALIPKLSFFPEGNISSANFGFEVYYNF